jgi:hypothetical protein
VVYMITRGGRAILIAVIRLLGSQRPRHRVRNRESLQSAKHIRCIALVCVAASAFGLTACGSKVRAHTTGRSHASASVVLRDFLLKPSGILLGMHPTEARIVVSAAAAAPLKVCQLGTTFSTYWKGGCRLLGAQVTLPTSGGAVHIGFRVLPWNGRPTRVMALQVRWHCVDHFFSLLRGKTVLRRASPVFDC